MKNYVIAGMLFLLLTGASLFLPSRVLRWQDEQRTGKSETEEVREVVLKEQISMTLSEKLKLRGQATVNTLSLVNGKNYNKDTIKDQIKKELETLAEEEILLDFDTELLEVIEANVTFYVDMEDSEKSIMLWDGYVQTPRWSLSFWMDDETGKILGFTRAGRGEPGNYAEARDSETDVQYSVTSVTVSKYYLDITAEQLEEISRRFSGYLGCEVAALSAYWSDLPRKEEEFFQKEVEDLIRKGYTEEEAERKTALAWGLDPEETKALRVTLEDEAGTVDYTFEAWEDVFMVGAFLSD